tara:strand:+ start:1858 stop:2694 length:837 start_codon:yes stop_codon:yes gene_type:complete
MATFQARIEDLTGMVEDAYKSGNSDADTINDAIRDAIYEIINLAPPEMIHAVTQSSSEQVSNGINNPNIKILQVLREAGVDNDFIACKEMGLDYERKVQNPSSPFYATKENPVFIRKDAKIYVYPAPSSNPDTFKYTYANYPTGDYANQSTIATFPDEWEYIVVYGAAVRCCNRLMSNIDAEIKDATDNAKLLFDTQLNDVSGGAGTAESILHFLSEEDSEMVQATSTGAQAELARMQSLLAEKQSLQQNIQNLSGMYKSALQSAGLAQFAQQSPQGQ